MIVAVNKTRGDNQAAGVNLASCGAIEVPTHRSDPIPDNCQVRPIPGRTSPVHDAAVAQDQVIHGAPLKGESLARTE